MLKAEHIHYSIGRHKILNNVSATFLPGAVNMILGPNGSGKSTFLRIFSGEINHFEGTVLYNDKNIRLEKKEALAKYRAVMSQQTELGFPLTVEEVIMMGRYPHFDFNATKKDESVCSEVIAKLKLEPFRQRNYLTLSGGEKQRVQFARVLAQVWEQPAAGRRYLFLDEPLSSLDINYQQEFLNIAKVFAQQNTVLVAIMHDINLAVQYADRLFFLKQGQMIAQGKPEEILTEQLVEEVFEVKTVIVSNPVTGKPLVVFR